MKSASIFNLGGGRDCFARSVTSAPVVQTAKVHRNNKWPCIIYLTGRYLFISFQFNSLVSTSLLFRHNVEKNKNTMPPRRRRNATDDRATKTLTSVGLMRPHRP
jgi:hypothetical protein